MRQSILKLFIFTLLFNCFAGLATSVDAKAISNVSVKSAPTTSSSTASKPQSIKLTTKSVSTLIQPGEYITFSAVCANADKSACEVEAGDSDSDIKVEVTSTSTAGEYEVKVTAVNPSRTGKVLRQKFTVKATADEKVTATGKVNIKHPEFKTLALDSSDYTVVTGEYGYAEAEFTATAMNGESFIPGMRLIRAPKWLKVETVENEPLKFKLSGTRLPKGKNELTGKIVFASIARKGVKVEANVTFTSRQATEIVLNPAAVNIKTGVPNVIGFKVKYNDGTESSELSAIDKITSSNSSIANGTVTDDNKITVTGGSSTTSSAMITVEAEGVKAFFTVNVQP